MASRTRFRSRYEKLHKGYSKRATNELLGTFKGWMNKIEWNELLPGAYKSQISNVFKVEDLVMSYARIYNVIGLDYGKRVGKDINKQLEKQTKEFTLAQFLTMFEMNVNQLIRLFSLSRIGLVRKQFFEFITDLIQTRLDKGLTMREVASEIKREVNKRDFYRWQAERIARTESTGASNYAAGEAARASGFVMVKEWVSTHDARTRRFPEDKFDHVAMDGKKVDMNENFTVNEGLFNQEELAFPGDPRGSAGDIINCRCAVSYVPKKGKDGRLIRTR